MHFLPEVRTQLRLYFEGCDSFLNRCDELGLRALMIANFKGDELRREFDALLDQPGDVPEVAVLESVLAKSECDDLVCQNLFAALRLENETRCAEIDAIEIT